MMGIVVKHFDGVPVVQPREDIDAANARQLRDELSRCLEDADRMVLDLSETRYVDSAGIDMLFRLNDLLAQRRASLVLVIPRSSSLTRLAQIVALPSVVPIHETVEQALADRSTPAGA
jgi:anti-anti-sigma factor